MCWMKEREKSNSLLGPLVLAANLILLLRSEIVLNVESLADFLGRLALDHISDSLAADVQQSLDIEVIGSLKRRRRKMVSEWLGWVDFRFRFHFRRGRGSGSNQTSVRVTHQNDLEKHLLVNLHELLVPFFDIAGLAAVVVLVTGGGGVVLVVLAPLDDLAEDGLVDLRGGVLVLA